MELQMMFSAKPDDIERFGVILMVGFRLFTAFFARHPLYFSPLDIDAEVRARNVFPALLIV